MDYLWFKRMGDPGSTQTNAEHGWFSTSTNPGHQELIHDTRTGTPYTMPAVTDKQRVAIEANLAAHGLTPQMVADNMDKAYQDGLKRMTTDPAIVALGLSPQEATMWYQYEHDSAMTYADHNQTAYVCASEVACTTSKAQWSMVTGDTSNVGPGITVYPNLTAAASVAAFGIENPEISLTQEDCDKINNSMGTVPMTLDQAQAYGGTSVDHVPGATKLAIDTYGGQPMVDAQGNSTFAGVLYPTLNNDGSPILGADGQPLVVMADDLSDAQLGKYIDMSNNSLIPGVPIGLPDGLTRGLEIARGADPADVLNGQKQSSFTTNIAFPGVNTTTTNDTHIGAEFLTGATYAEGTLVDNSKNADPNGPTYPPNTPMSAPDLAKYVQGFYNTGSGAGYRYVTETLMANATAAGVMGHQYQAVSWVGDPSIDAASTKSVHGDVLKNAKPHVMFPYGVSANDDELEGSEGGEALRAPVIPLARKCIVTGQKDMWPKDQRHMHKPVPGRNRSSGYYKHAPSFTGKRFGDPNSTQMQDEHGRFTPGSGGASTIVPNSTKAGEAGNTTLSTVFNNPTDLIHVLPPIGSDSATTDDKSGMSAAMKNQVVKDLSTRSGLSEDRTNDLVRAWATSSSDTNPDSIALQLAVAQQFGATPQATAYLQTAAAAAGNTSTNADDLVAELQPDGSYKLPDATSTTQAPDQRTADASAFVSAMYAATQAQLASAGITEVTVYRGVNFASQGLMDSGVAQDVPLMPADFNSVVQANPEADAENGVTGSVMPSNDNGVNVAVALNPASSFSTRDDKAASFAMEGDGNVPIIMYATVPAASILATPLTGIGCLAESEVVVIGGKAPVNVHATMMS